MINTKKLNKALNTIRKECLKHGDCSDCPFYNFHEGDNCNIVSDKPIHWDVSDQISINMFN